MPSLRTYLTAFCYLWFSLPLLADDVPSDEAIAFFEEHIRPVLVDKCYKCHNSAESDEAGLAVDYREGIRGETELGQVVIPHDPDNSVLLKVIRHEVDGLEMPEDAGKLDETTIEKFRQWIQMGAPDPRDAPPTNAELQQATSWETTLAHRKRWWSLQPIGSVEPPSLANVHHPVDRFIQARLQTAGLVPSSPADRRTLIRRASYVLTGLPPSPQQIHEFLNAPNDDGYESLVDELLASERFGERWARHWMDLMRYADSHGSEGDPAIPEIYRYRDYLIRAFNADVPYDQLMREHIAGDLLSEPRTNEQLGINESRIGPAHWRLVFHGFAPTDPLDEKVRFTDDQINVFSKAFLGLTVSCARCHDHKFDAISQRDYYGLFGVLASCRPALRDVNLPHVQERHKSELAERKAVLRTKLGDHWLGRLDELRSKLRGDTQVWGNKISQHAEPHQLFYLLKAFRQRATSEDTWESLQGEWRTYRESIMASRRVPNTQRWDFTSAGDYERWYRDGNGLPAVPSVPGDFRVGSSEQIVTSILPAGVHANTLSTKHRAFLCSPRFNLNDRYKVWFHVHGGGQSMTRYAVENYPRDGTVYPIRDINRQQWHWQEYDLSYWQGDSVHLEVNTARDAPLRVRSPERSWFGVREVLIRPASAPPPAEDRRAFARSLFATTRHPKNIEEMAEVYVEAIRRSIRSWVNGGITDDQALLLDACLREAILENRAEQIPSLQADLTRFLELEADVAVPTRVPGLLEADAFHQPLFVRGNHRRPADPVPRRFLEAIDGRPFESLQSGRRELAEKLVDRSNPLVARVMVNRIWQYVFGQGLVTTPDNFGQLGQRPSHPELLDYLAHRFSRDWSVKNMVRFLVTSETFRQRSQPTPASTDRDPANRLLSHAQVRRLEAEAIRDSLMAVSGRLSLEMYGPGFAPNGDNPTSGRLCSQPPQLVRFVSRELQRADSVLHHRPQERHQHPGAVAHDVEFSLCDESGPCVGESAGSRGLGTTSTHPNDVRNGAGAACCGIGANGTLGLPAISRRRIAGTRPAEGGLGSGNPDNSGLAG